MTNHRVSTKKHNTIFLLVAFAMIGLGVAVVLIFSPRNVTSGPVGGPEQYNAPVAGLELPLTHLEGQWYMKENDTAFVANVVGNDIKIEMVTGDGISATYWHGTFETAESPGKVINSTKTEAQDEIVLSQSATKDFTIGKDSITFKFSAMGFSKNIELHR